MTSSMPTSAATARAVVSLSPVSRTGRSPSAFSDATASAELSLTVSATTKTARRSAVPAGGDRGLPARLGGAAGGVELGRQVHRPVGQQRGAPDDERVAVDDALDAEALAVGEALDRRERALGGGGLGDRLGDRVLGGVLERADEPQRLVAVDAVGDGDLDEAHPAGGDRAGLVEHDRVDAARGLEDLRALDQQAELGAAAGADHQRRRRGQPERARAGDDQHGDRGGERERRALARAEPEAERRDGDARSRPGRRRPRCGRRGAGPAPCRSGRPRRAGRSAPARCRRRPSWRGRPAPAGVDGRARDLRAGLRPRPAPTRR